MYKIMYLLMGKDFVVEIFYGCVLWCNFFGQLLDWYKLVLIIFLIVNLLVFVVVLFVVGWLLVVEFIFIFVMVLKCYLLLLGGLLVIEVLLIGMISLVYVWDEIVGNLEVLFLLMFMVVGIYFMKQFLLFVFMCLLLGICSKMLLLLVFCLVVVFFLVFFDVLMVVVVVISVVVGFYGIYYCVVLVCLDDSDLFDDSYIEQYYCEVLEQFCGFLCSLMMYVGVGIVFGGVMIMVGEL